MASTSGTGTDCAAPTAGWARSLTLAAAALLLLGAIPAARLDVEVTGLRSPTGKVRICLTRDPHNFPDCVGDANAVRRSIPAASASTAFEGLSPGGYALALIHDANGNGRLDTFAGIPREGFGFSRNPRIRFGPPGFAAARFVMTGDASRQQVRMRYIL